MQQSKLRLSEMTAATFLKTDKTESLFFNIFFAGSLRTLWPDK
jgi:hypothetical protein